MEKKPFDITLLTSKEVADHLKVNEQTLRKWRSNGTGPKFFKTQGMVRYMRIHVQEWLEANTTV